MHSLHGECATAAAEHVVAQLMAAARLRFVAAAMENGLALAAARNSRPQAPLAASPWDGRNAQALLRIRTHRDSPCIHNWGERRTNKNKRQAGRELSAARARRCRQE